MKFRRSGTLSNHDHILILPPTIALVQRDGGWGTWSMWTTCDKGCDGGKRKRHRFCDNPFPLHGGDDCPGDRYETEDCNTESCPSKCSTVLREREKKKW